jgi:chromosome segregation ATPase
MAEPAPQEMPQSELEDSSRSDSSQSDLQELPQPDPEKIAQHFHSIAEQMALIGNLRAVHEVTELQQLTRAIKGMRKDLKTIKKDMGKVQKDMGKVQTDVTDMRTEMQEGFTRLETKISVMYVLISFGDSGLTLTRSDHNSAHNATINNLRSFL